MLAGAVSAAETPDETVAMEDNTLSVSQNYSSELNSNQESLNNEKSFNDLQTTINSLSDNDVLDLDCDYKYNGTSDFNGITIAQNNVTINGNHHTLDANAGDKNVRIFFITGNNVILKNLVFTNGNCDYGGVIYNCGVGSNVCNSTFINNNASLGGGAIYNTKANFTVTDSEFISNSATTGGAIYNYGGEGFSVNNSTFINNTADSSGAIYSVLANLNVINSRFINNSATLFSAGAVYNGGTNSTIINSTFKGNSANANGGAVFNSESSFSVINSTFFNNTAGVDAGAIYSLRVVEVNIISSIFEDNCASIDGGAIYNGLGKEFSIIDSKFINNAASFYGGAVFSDDGESFKVSNSTFKGNNASYGSAVGSSGISSGVYNSTFEANTASCGGTIFNAGDFAVNDSIFTDNNVSFAAACYNGVEGVLNLSNNKYSGIDGDKTYIHNEGTLGSVNITVLENKTIDIKYGQNITLFANITTSDGASVSGGLLNFTINGNNYSAYTQDDGNYTYKYAPNTTGKQLVGATYEYANNIAVKTGIINVKVSDVYVDYENGNDTNDGASWTNAVKTIGHAMEIVLENGNVYLAEGTHIVNNQIAIFETVSIIGNGNKTLITNNKGNGIFQITANNVAIYNCTFTNNTGIITVGMLFNSGDNLTVDNCIFSNNSADSACVIRNFGLGCCVSNSIFVNNSATGYGGGAIYNAGENLTVINSTFEANTANSNGGAIFNSVKGFNVINSTFNNNFVYGCGAAIYNFGGAQLSVTNSTFSNNTAFSGGAIYNRWGDLFSIADSVFVNNSATNYAGAVFSEGSTGHETEEGFIVSNSIFKGNNASYGGAIGNSCINACVNNSTFEGNTAIYAGAIFTDADLVVGNSTFDNNIAEAAVALYNGIHGVLNLSNNKYSGIDVNKTYIYNEGILGGVNVTVLENKTIDVSYGDVVVLSATITYDNVNVSGNNLYFIINGTKIGAASFLNGSYIVNYTIGFFDKQIVNASYEGINSTNIFVNTGVLNAEKSPNDVILTADNVVMFYNDGSKFTAMLMDYKGNPLANMTLSFVINGINYTRQTNENGSASINLRLKSGVYTGCVLFNGYGNYSNASKNITVNIKSTIEGSDIVKMYQNETQFQATFLDSNGDVLANTTVKFNINGVFYNRTTDDNGTARLNINLMPGNYTLTAYNPFNDEQKGFNVLVKSLIETSDLTKYYLNASQFRAKVYNKDGSLAINKTVNFIINGVSYNRNTDANGTVELNINLRPGNYTITTMYENLTVGNKVSVLPTLETSDLSMKFKDGSKFMAKTLNGQGEPLANQNITFNVNGVLYYKTTWNDGVASLNINLMKGNYIITSIWDNYEVANEIKIV